MASNFAAGQAAGSSGSCLLKPQNVAIALTPDRSTVVLRFHSAEGMNIEIGIARDDVPKPQEALDVTSKHLAEGGAQKTG